MKLKFQHWSKMITVMVLALICCVVGLAGCGKHSDNSVQNIKQKNELVVGTSADYAPFEFPITKHDKQQIVGFDILLAHQIAKQLGIKKVKVINMQFPSLISELKNKKVDLVMAGMVKTPQRAKVVAFSKPYYYNRNVLLVSAKNANKFQSVKDLKGHTVGAQQSSSQAKIAKQLHGVKNVEESSNNSLTSEVKSGTLDGVILNRPVAEGYAKEQPNNYAIAKRVHFHYTKFNKITASTRIVARHEDKALMKIVNQTITKDRHNGTMNKLFKQAQRIQVANNK